MKFSLPSMCANARLFDVYRLNLLSGEATLEVENPGDVAGWVADHHLQVRVAHVIRPNGGTTLRVREHDSPWRILLEAPHEETLDAQGFDEQGRLLLASSLEANAARLVAYTFDDQSISVIAEDPAFDVAGTMQNPLTHTIEAVAFERARLEWSHIAPQVASDIQAISALCDGDWQVTSRDRADQLWTIQFVVDDGPTRFYLYDRTSKTGRLLFTSQPALEAFTLSKMIPVSFPARDGLLLHGYLSLPSNYQPGTVFTDDFASSRRPLASGFVGIPCRCTVVNKPRLWSTASQFPRVYRFWQASPQCR